MRQLLLEQPLREALAESVAAGLRCLPAKTTAVRYCSWISLATMMSIITAAAPTTPAPSALKAIPTAELPAARSAVILLAQSQASAVTQDGPIPARLEFEAAAIRLSAPLIAGDPLKQGGPGTADPGRLTIRRMPLRNLLFNAYGVRPDQIAGPDWLDKEVFDITATIPPGTTKEQADVMLQNLLLKRFKISLHRTTKDALAYDLSVAKTGSKLKEVTRGPDAAAIRPGEFLAHRLDFDASEFPVIPEGEVGIVAVPRNGETRMTCRACSIADLIGRIRQDLAEVSFNTPSPYFTLARLVDKTGLTGTYDFHLEYSSTGGIGSALQPPSLDDQGQPNADLFTALREQLGLRLEKTKAPLDVWVVDQAEKIPTDN